MNNDKLSFFGSFNEVLTHAEIAKKQIKELWNNGEIRLKLDDIEQMAAIERKIKGELSEIKAFKELFSGIANHRVEEEEKK